MEEDAQKWRVAPGDEQEDAAEVEDAEDEDCHMPEGEEGVVQGRRDVQRVQSDAVHDGGGPLACLAEGRTLQLGRSPKWVAVCPTPGARNPKSR